MATFLYRKKAISVSVSFLILSKLAPNNSIVFFSDSKVFNSCFAVICSRESGTEKIIDFFKFSILSVILTFNASSILVVAAILMALVSFKFCLFIQDESFFLAIQETSFFEVSNKDFHFSLYKAIALSGSFIALA